MARYIDADAVVRKMCGNRCGCERYECGGDVPCETVDMIESAPTISPDEARGIGKWEDVSVHDNIQNIMIAAMRCNVCKRYHNEVYHYGNPTEMARYCPVCGAKMEVSEDA